MNSGGGEVTDGVNDGDTYLELVEYHHDWMAAAAGCLTRSRDWDLFFLQVHTPDSANDYFLPTADPV